MNPLDSVGRMLLVFGGALMLMGGVVLFLGRVPLAGRLPGDLRFHWGNVSCYLPLMTGLALSIFATLLLNLILWALRK
jgi:hypothetical protein